MVRKILCLGLATFLSVPAWAGNTVKSSLRFAFHQGEQLIYRVEQNVKGKTYAASLTGQVTLSVQRVLPDGTAEMEVTASGQGQMHAKQETIKFDTDPPAPVVIVVTPTGVITELRDTSGKRTTLLEQDETDPINVNRVLRAYAIGTYTLFGLQLPDHPVAVRETWNGNQQYEIGHYAESSDEEEQLVVNKKNRKVKYTYLGEHAYQGHTYPSITASIGLHVDQADIQQDLPGAYWLDVKQGRIVGVKIETTKLGKEGATLTYRVMLVEKPL